MRCPHCGFLNPRGALNCGRCGRALLPSGQPDRRPIEPSPPDYPRPELDGGETGLRLPEPAAGPMAAPQSARGLALIPRAPGSLGWLSRRPELVGTVIAADQVYYEPPDFDGIRLLNRLLLLIEFLGLPFLMLWALLRFAGPLSLILGILGLYLFFKFISPSNLFALLGLFHFLTPRRAREDQVPVQYLRVRDPSAEQERIVRRKGHLRSGHLMPGDEVALWGRWRGGVLHLKSGLNLRTRAQIVMQPSHSWAWLALNLLILSAFIGLFYEPLRRILELIVR